MADTAGRVSSLTVLAPVRVALTGALEDALRALQTDATAPLAAGRRTHFARLAVLDDVPSTGPRRRPERLSGPHLLFTSRFDGPLHSYLTELHGSMRATAGQVWGCCAGYPDDAGVVAFSAYLCGRRLRATCFLAAHDEPVAEVLRALDVRRRVRDFARQVPGASASDLDAALRELEDAVPRADR